MLNPAFRHFESFTIKAIAQFDKPVPHNCSFLKNNNVHSFEIFFPICVLKSMLEVFEMNQSISS